MSLTGAKAHRANPTNFLAELKRRNVFTSEIDKGLNQLLLAWTQRLASDTAGAKVTGEKARSTIDLLYGEQPDNFELAVTISQAYAVMGEKDSALREAQRAITLLPHAKDPASGPALQNFALIQMTFGQNSSAISTPRQLLQTPYDGELYATPIAPALLRLDPLWDPLRADPAFQKLCEEKQPRTPCAISVGAIDSNGRTIFVADAHRLTEAQRDVPTKKPAPARGNEPEPGHNRGDDLPADETQLLSVG